MRFSAEGKNVRLCASGRRGGRVGSQGDEGVNVPYKAAKACPILWDTPGRKEPHHSPSLLVLLLPDLKPLFSLRLCYVQLITGFVFHSFIQPLCPCGQESLSANPPPAASSAPFSLPIYPPKGYLDKHRGSAWRRNQNFTLSTD